MDMICKCGSKAFFTEKHGNQTGLYCSACGKWQKWLGKDEVRLFNHGVKNGWISVKDRLPDNARFVLLYVKTKKQTGYAFGWFNNKTKQWSCTQRLFNSNFEFEKVTYWRELPNPPRMEESKE